jgi:hypothetical protein
VLGLLVETGDAMIVWMFALNAVLAVMAVDATEAALRWARKLGDGT